MVFKPGQSGNPKGREKGTRDNINRAFLLKLQEHFFKFGESALNRMCFEDPSGYIKVVASLLPKEFKIDADIEVGSKSISEFNRWLAEATRSPGIPSNNPLTIENGSLLPLEIRDEQEGCSEPVDIQQVQGSPTKPKWLS